MATNLTAKKVAIYIRVSTHWQADKDSLKVQERELIAYCEMVLGIDSYELFIDPGYSAKNTERPAYKQMMARLRTGEFSHVLVWKIDRISRNLLDFSSMYSELKRSGITFVSKHEQFDTSSAIGEAMLKIILVFAELERNMTSERVTAVMLSRASNSQWNGGRVPFGYDYAKESKEFSINEYEAAIVRLIYDLYEQYQSIYYIAKHLTDHGYRTKKGLNFSTTTVHKILTNVFYKGSYRYNVHADGTGYIVKDESEWIEIENHHKPIVAEEQYNRVQFLLRRNKRGGNERGKTFQRTNVHMFAGLLSCDNCGSNLVSCPGKLRADGWRPSHYICSTKKYDRETCNSKIISDKTLGPFVFGYVANIIRAKDKIKASTPLPDIEKRLLKGGLQKGVKRISEASLQSFKDLALQGDSGVEYRSPIIFNNDRKTPDRIQALKEQRKTSEVAFDRLKALYLYSPDSIPEKDFAIESKRLMDEMNSIDAEISKIIDECEGDECASQEFIEKGSYLIMVDKILQQKASTYEKYLKSITPIVAQSFLRSIISGITVYDGRVCSITFKNGAVHRFEY